MRRFSWQNELVAAFWSGLSTGVQLVVLLILEHWQMPRSSSSPIYLYFSSFYFLRFTSFFFLMYKELTSLSLARWVLKNSFKEDPLIQPNGLFVLHDGDPGGTCSATFPGRMSRHGKSKNPGWIFTVTPVELLLALRSSTRERELSPGPFGSRTLMLSCVCVVYAHISECGRRGRTVGTLLYHSPSSYSLEVVLSRNLEPDWWSASPRDPVSVPSQRWCYRCVYDHTCLFTWAFGIWTQISIHVQYMILHNESFPSLHGFLCIPFS